MMDNDFKMALDDSYFLHTIARYFNGPSYGHWATRLTGIADRMDAKAAPIAQAEPTDRATLISQIVAQADLVEQRNKDNAALCEQLAAQRKELSNAKGLLVDVYAMLPEQAAAARQAIDKRTGNWLVWGVDRSSTQPGPAAEPTAQPLAPIKLLNVAVAETSNLRG